MFWSLPKATFRERSASLSVCMLQNSVPICAPYADVLNHFRVSDFHVAVLLGWHLVRGGSWCIAHL